jgi:predicted component of viral defense system (DUF524 family)
MIKKHEILIPINSINSGLALHIYEEVDGTLIELDDNEALENGESKFQLLEGRSYSYYFKNLNFQLKEIAGIVKNSRRTDVSEGRINTNTYVGTLTLYVIDKEDPSFEEKVFIEVLSTKMNFEPDKSYRENYRFMLESITDKCTELLMQINSPINQQYEIDFERDNKTIYQRFTFVKSIIFSNEFNEAIQKLISSPTTRWKQNEELIDIRSIRRFSNSNIKQLTSATNRISLPKGHLLESKYKLYDIPSKIISTRKAETLDTPENRFIKHALSVFLKFSNDCLHIFSIEKYDRAEIEAKSIIINLENHLNHPFFKDIGTPEFLKLNSPILQRKSGYREILNAWLKFDLAAKLIWSGGDDIYNAGKRDIAVLYEYWLFFTLYDLIKEKFKIENHKHQEKPYDHLIVPTNDGLNVMVKSGKHTALEGIFDSGYRKLNVKFSYNRTFTGGTEYINQANKKLAGSWTKTLRPDYTLSFWPSEINEESAEEKELIVHIHFDSKYKVDQFIINSNSSAMADSEDLSSELENLLNEEKEEEKKGKYKHADLLKMHAYKDAIRRTGGAYILYPGTENQKPLKGFHEIIPGLGAFAVRPSIENNGVSELSNFIDSVINHLLDRASQRENAAVKSYEIHKVKKKEYLDDNVTPNILNEPIPEYFDPSKSLKIIPDETFILVGYCRNIENLSWYMREGIYNFRMDDEHGSLALTSQVVSAKYLLIREAGNNLASKIFKITSNGPKVITGTTLKDLGYKSEKLKDYYLVINIDKELCKDFNLSKFNFTELEEYKKIKSEYNPYSASGMPFTITLSELMKVIVK